VGMSDRRKMMRAKRKAAKEARLKNPGKDSKYARKLRGIYPAGSPYLTGDWGQPQKIDSFFTPAPVPSEWRKGVR
jgi:hypothetical protein